MIDARHSLKTGSESQHMNPPTAPSLWSVAVQFRAQDEFYTVQLKQTVACVLEFLAGLSKPCGMSEVSGGEQINSLDLGPVGKILEVQLAASGAGVGRVDVEVSGVSHAGILPRPPNIAIFAA